MYIWYRFRLRFLFLFFFLRYYCWKQYPSITIYMEYSYKFWCKREYKLSKIHHFPRTSNIFPFHIKLHYTPKFIGTEHIGQLSQSGLLSRWTARGTNDKPRALRRPKVTAEGDESEVVSLDTAETRPSMALSHLLSTSIAEEDPSSDCLCRVCFTRCFLEGRDFLKNSNEVGNLCLSTTCWWRLL